MFSKSLSEIKYNWRELGLLFIYTILIVFFCSKMSPFYPIQEWSDVNLYFNIGKTLMNGQTLYVDSFDHKGPIIFFIYGIGYLISNDSFLGLFFIQIFVWCSLVFVAYFIAKLFLNKAYSFAIAASYLYFFISHTSEGGSAEEFITAFMAVSLYFFIRYFRNPEQHNLGHMYIHGLMWGLVFFTKFNLVAFWIFPLIGIGVILLMKKEYKKLLQNVVAFVAGGFTIALLLLLYFAIQGGLADAIDAYFLINSSSKLDSIGNIINRIIVSFYQRLRFETFEFGLICLGAFIFPLIYLKNNIARLSIALSFLSIFTMVFMAGYVYYYSIPYYLYVILGLIVIVGVIARFLSAKWQWGFAAVVLLIALTAGIERKNFFGKYNSNQTTTVIDEFLPIIQQEEDRTLINLALDDANALFTYGNIMPNVKYFITPNLAYEVYPEMRDEQTKYIEEKRTMFVVLAELTLNAEYFLNLDALKDNYEIVGRFKEFYAWHNADRYYYLYKRKENK